MLNVSCGHPLGNTQLFPFQHISVLIYVDYNTNILWLYTLHRSPSDNSHGRERQPGHSGYGGSFPTAPKPQSIAPAASRPLAPNPLTSRPPARSFTCKTYEPFPSHAVQSPSTSSGRTTKGMRLFQPCTHSIGKGRQPNAASVYCIAFVCVASFDVVRLYWLKASSSVILYLRLTFVNSCKEARVWRSSRAPLPPNESIFTIA